MASHQQVGIILNLVDVTGAKIGQGSVKIQPSVQLTDATDNLEVPTAPAWAAMNGVAFPSVTVYATDSAGLLPSGWGLQISYPGIPGYPASQTFLAPAGPLSFTATNASPCVFTWTPTSQFTVMPDSAAVQLSGGSLPAGFSAATTYYVVNASAFTFSLAATVNGTPLASTGSGSGTLTVTQYFLSSLTPVSSVTTMAAYLPLPSGTPSSGQVPIATGSGEASAWGTVTSGFANPMTTPGDTIYGGTAGAATRLAGDTSNTRKFYREQSIAGVAQAPAWDTIQAQDVASSPVAGAPLVAVSQTQAEWGSPCQFYVPRLGSGSNDGANTITAITNAIAYAASNQGYAEICTMDASGQYLMNSAATIGGAGFQGNAILPLPVQSATAQKITLRFKGAASLGADTLPHWLQQVPQQGGTVWATTRTDGTNDATYGPAFVLGGPWNGYGENAVFSNMCVILDGITVQPPFNGTYGGFGFWGVAQARVLSASYMPSAVVPSGTGFPQFNANSISNQWTIGLLMPAVNNNLLCDILYFSAYGATYGLMATEHTTCVSVRCNYCVVGVSPVVGGGDTLAHPILLGEVAAETNVYAIGIYPNAGINSKLNGYPNFQVRTLDTEGNTFILHDPGNLATGQIAFQGIDAVNGYLNTGAIQSGGTGVKMIALGQQAGPVSSSAAPPATTVAWPNYYYRDAWVTVALSGGHTFTSLDIDSAAQPNAAGAGTYQFLLPSGHSYTPAYSAGTLTHTVTLL